MAVIKRIREQAKRTCEKADKLMVKKNLSRNPPSMYEIGEKVVVRVTKSKKVTRLRERGCLFQLHMRQ